MSNYSVRQKPMKAEWDVGKVKHLSFNPHTGKHDSSSPVEKFIKGPIPLGWVIQANQMAGKAGPIGVALWFYAGLNKSKTFKLTKELERIAGCERKAIYAALQALERGGLIIVQRFPSARPVVTLQDCKK